MLRWHVVLEAADLLFLGVHQLAIFSAEISDLLPSAIDQEQRLGATMALTTQSPSEIFSAFYGKAWTWKSPILPFFEALVGWLAGQSALRALFTVKPASIAVPAASATRPPRPMIWF